MQQELAMETKHHQEMSEEVKRLKKELNSRFTDSNAILCGSFYILCIAVIFVDLLPWERAENSTNDSWNSCVQQMLNWSHSMTIIE